LENQRDLPAPEVRRALRRAARLSLRDVADHLGVTPASVAYWETGQRFPRRDHLAAYVAFLAVLSRTETP
jgi:transcriptional regulator with XRE-family HTH domain